MPIICLIINFEEHAGEWAGSGWQNFDCRQTALRVI